MTDSATFTTLETDDENLGEDLGGLDDLLASLRSEEEPAMKRGRGRAKKEAPAKDFKAVLWASADKLRAQMDAAESKHLVLGLIFTQENVFWVPADARWESLRARTANALIEWKDASGPPCASTVKDR